MQSLRQVSSGPKRQGNYFIVLHKTTGREREGTKEEKALLIESRHVGETQFSHREERLILVQGRRLVLQNILLKTTCETQTSILIS